MNKKKGIKAKQEDRFPAKLLAKIKSYLNQKRPLVLFVSTFFFLMIFFYSWWLSDYFLIKINPYIALINSGISSTLLNLLGQHTQSNGDLVYSPQFSISVKRGCDAMEAMALFSSAMLAFPTQWKKKLIGLMIGIFLLFSLNMIRIVSLFLTGVYAPRAFDIMHVEIWQALFIFIAMGLWIYFIRQTNLGGKYESH